MRFILALILVMVSPCVDGEQEACSSAGLVSYYGVCVDQLTAFRIVERWPNWGGVKSYP